GPGSALDPPAHRDSVPPGDRKLGCPGRVRGQEGGPQAAAARDRGRAGRARARRLPAAARGHVRPSRGRVGVLSADLRLAGLQSLVGARALRVARAGRGRRPRAVYDLPPRPASPLRLAGSLPFFGERTGRGESSAGFTPLPHRCLTEQTEVIGQWSWRV